MSLAFLLIAGCGCAPEMFPALLMAQTPVASPAASSAPSMRDRVMARIMGPEKSAWTPEQLGTMAKLRDAAVDDPYALTELRHLTDNIGPRISGSAQAQAAVEYVAAEMKALGAEVTLEKTTVPHWVRGTETGNLVSWPGMTAGNDSESCAYGTRRECRHAG